jgi:hypothetical protein
MDPAVVTILLSWIGITVTVFGHIYRQLSNAKQDMEKIAEDRMKDFSEEISEMKAKVSAISVELAADRRAQSEFRERIAEKMMSKDDFNIAFNRMIADMDRRWTTAIRERGPVRQGH